MQLARDSPPLGLLAGNEPAGQIAIERVRPFGVGHVAHHAEHAIAAGVDDASFEIASVVQREVVFDDDGVLPLTGTLDGLHDHLGQSRRHDVADLLADEHARRREQQLRIARVVVDIGAVAKQDEHQVRNGAQHGAVARFGLDQRLLGAPLFA